MEVDESGSELDVESLISYNIYDDDEFPLQLRIEMEPIIRKYDFYNHSLDFNSTDPQVYHNVNRTCKQFYDDVISQLNEIPRSGPHYVTVQPSDYFARTFADSREFVQIFFKKFENEKCLMSYFGDEILQSIQRQMEDYYRDLVKQQKHTQKIVELQVNEIRNLDEFHNSVMYNKQVMDRTSKSGAARLDSETLEKWNEQKKTYLSEGVSFKAKIKDDMADLKRYSSELLNYVKNFASLSHEYLTSIRIRNRNLLEKCLDDLTKKFTNVRENFQKLRRIIGIFEGKLNSSLYAKEFSLQKPSLELVIQAINEAKYELYKNAVVVSTEPQFTDRSLKKNKFIKQYELAVLFDRVDVSMSRIRAHLLSEAGLRRIRNELQDGQEPEVKEIDVGGKFEGNISSLDQGDHRRGFNLTFKDLKIIEVNRKHKTNMEVMKQKHAIFFSGPICIDDVEVKIQCFSLPVIVTVHGNQMTKGLAAIFWDDNFHREGRCGLEVKDKVGWSEMKNAIIQLFQRELDRKPTMLNLVYLKDRLMRETKGPEIRCDVFLKTPPKGKISFWEWLWGSIRLLDSDPTLRQLWIDGHIMGYISMNQAKRYLNECRNQEYPVEHTDAERLFLIRFSESDKEMITIQGHLFDQTKGGWNVFSVKPYKADSDLKSISLPQRVLDRSDCQTLLYEHNGGFAKARKGDIFKSVKPKEETPLRDGYIAWTLKERTDQSDLRNFRIDAGDEAGSCVSDLNPGEDGASYVSDVNPGDQEISCDELDEEIGPGKLVDYLLLDADMELYTAMSTD